MAVPVMPLLPAKATPAMTLPGRSDRTTRNVHTQ